MKLPPVVAAVSRRLRPTGVRFASFFGCFAYLLTSCVPIESDPIQLEVFSWWQEGSENHALSAVAKHHQATHSGVVIEERADPDAEVTRERLAARLLAGAPPATFLANSGADLLRWTVVDYELEAGHVSDCRIRDVFNLLESTGLWRELPVPLRTMLRVGDSSNAAYGVPLNIHRLNVLYYNADTVDPRSLRDISSLCPEPYDTAKPLGLRFAVSAKDKFSLVLLTFENVLPALTSAEFYEAFWRGEDPSSKSGGHWSRDVRRAVECVKYLSGSLVEDVDPATIEWAGAANLVADGRADFTVMGDWADATLREAITRGNVESVPFPSTEGIFVFTSDTFPLPVGTPHPQEAQEFLETLASSEAQRLFSEKKGSLPARLEMDIVDALGARARAAESAFSNATVVPALSGLLPYYFPNEELNAALALMIQNDDETQVDKVMEILESAYPLLAKWQRRLEDGAATPLP